MKVCFVTGTLGRGGAEKQLVFMLRALKKAGIETRVLCLTKGEAYEAEIRHLGVDVEYVGASQNWIVRLWKIVMNLRSQPADILQSSHFYTNIYAALAGKILGIPSIGAVRSNFASEMTLHRFFGRFQLSLPSLVIANSALARDSAIRNGVAPHKIEFVRNVIDEGSVITEMPSEQNGSMTFLFVGRLSKEKRADRFVRMAATLVEDHPDYPIRFRVAGDGPLRDDLNRQVASYPLLSDRIEFLGECSNMNEIYRAADVLVLTSDYEGTPNVILEAMAHALPVIATRVGGTPEILSEKCGILVEPNDETGLVRAAVRLIKDSDRSRLGHEGFLYVRNHHSLVSLQNHLIKIYERLNGPIQRKIELRHPSTQKN